MSLSIKILYKIYHVFWVIHANISYSFLSRCQVRPHKKLLGKRIKITEKSHPPQVKEILEENIKKLLDEWLKNQIVGFYEKKSTEFRKKEKQLLLEKIKNMLDKENDIIKTNKLLFIQRYLKSKLLTK